MGNRKFLPIVQKERPGRSIFNSKRGTHIGKGYPTLSLPHCLSACMVPFSQVSFSLVKLILEVAAA